MKCFACGRPAKFNVLLVVDDASTPPRIYLPNQNVRNETLPMPQHRPVHFCHECMHQIEDNLRVTILNLQSEAQLLSPKP
jgi:hypothetical protein